MRLLWFVNIPFPAVRKRIDLPAAGGSGFWMVELMEGLRSLGLDIHVCWSGRQCTEPMTFSEKGTTYYCANESKSEEFGLSCSLLLDHWTSIMGEVAPDLIEFHGSEKYHGLLASRVEIPALVEIQGVLQACTEHYFGPLGVLERLRFKPLCRQYLSYLIRSIRERKIFRINNAFVGRTDWDRNMLGSMNPYAHYFSCPRIVREPFRQRSWKPPPPGKALVFVSTASAKPLKGCDLPIRALGEMRRRGMEARLVLVGRFPESGYGSWLRRLAQREGVADLLDFAGYMGSEGITEVYSEARAFILPSYIENSPNVLAEAMTFGMPCLASNTGGIPSMFDNGTTGLLFPTGNHLALVELLEELVAHPWSAEELGANARKSVLELHAPAYVSARMLDIYGAVSSAGIR